MSSLNLRVVLDHEPTARAWAAEIAAHLREIARQVETAPGAIDLRTDWPDLEAWRPS